MIRTNRIGWLQQLAKSPGGRLLQPELARWLQRRDMVAGQGDGWYMLTLKGANALELALLQRARHRGDASGGLDACPRRCVDCEGEKHHWGEYFGFKEEEPDEDDDSSGPEHPAAKAGLLAWQVCKHCPAWRQMPDDDEDLGDEDLDDELVSLLSREDA